MNVKHYIKDKPPFQQILHRIAAWAGFVSIDIARVYGDHRYSYGFECGKESIFPSEVKVLTPFNSNNWMNLSVVVQKKKKRKGRHP